MMTYDMIKRNFDRKLWTVAQVAFAVKAGIITAAQFKEITGQKYVN